MLPRGPPHAVSGLPGRVVPMCREPETVGRAPLCTSPFPSRHPLRSACLVWIVEREQPVGLSELVTLYTIYTLDLYISPMADPTPILKLDTPRGHALARLMLADLINYEPRNYQIQAVFSSLDGVHVVGVVLTDRWRQDGLLRTAHPPRVRVL
jgi:hypothetical protein